MEFWQNQNGSFAGKLAPRSPAPIILLYLRLLSSHRIFAVIRLNTCARHSLTQLYARHIVPRNCCLYARSLGQAAADSRLGSLLTRRVSLCPCAGVTRFQSLSVMRKADPAK